MTRLRASAMPEVLGYPVKFVDWFPPTVGVIKLGKSEGIPDTLVRVVSPRGHRLIFKARNDAEIAEIRKVVDMLDADDRRQQGYRYLRNMEPNR